VDAAINGLARALFATDLLNADESAEWQQAGGAQIAVALQ